MASYIKKGISIHDSKLSYFDFLRAIDDGRASYQQRQKQAAPPASFAALGLGQTLINIKEIVASSYDLLYKTEEGQKVIPPKSSLELSDQGILSQVQEVVTAGFNTIAQEFKDTASSKDNTVSKEEFWDIRNRHQRLTEEQFENLWNIVDFSAGGRLKYDDYLKKFSSEVVTMPSSTPSATGSATSAKPAARTMQDPRVSSHPERPKTSSSLVGQKSVLHEYGINLTEEELFNILEYDDKNLSSKISYNDFLRAFIQKDLVKCRKL